MRVRTTYVCVCYVRACVRVCVPSANLRLRFWSRFCAADTVSAVERVRLGALAERDDARRVAHVLDCAGAVVEPARAAFRTCPSALPISVVTIRHWSTYVRRLTRLQPHAPGANTVRCAACRMRRIVRRHRAAAHQAPVRATAMNTIARAHIQACTYAGTMARNHARARTHTHTRARTHTHTRARARTHTRTHTRTQARAPLPNTQIHTHRHAHRRARAHARTHARIRVARLFFDAAEVRDQPP